MGKSQDRLFEAINYGVGEKAILTTKQYLVYSYLMSISKWDSADKEKHYYVYKNSFKVKDACEQLKITQPTWRSSIKKLKETLYIQEYEKFYIIEIPNTYAPLDIKLISFLIPFGAAINTGGNIVSIYSLIYRYWDIMTQNGSPCEITINQLRAIFHERRDSQTLFSYKIMLNLFVYYNLISLTKVTREFEGAPYTSYVINHVSTTINTKIDSDENAPDNVNEILTVLENTANESK